MTTLIILLVVGYMLVIAEMVLPGGVLGIMGVICLLGAAIWAFMEFDATTGFIIVLIEVISGIILISLWMKYFFDSRFGHRLVLGSRDPDADPNTTQDGSSESYQDLLNQTGTALTTLRPSGTARINGRRVDVLSEGDLIDQGEPIRVVKVDGTHIFVRRHLSNEPSTSNQ